MMMKKKIYLFLMIVLVAVLGCFVCAQAASDISLSLDGESTYWRGHVGDTLEIEADYYPTYRYERIYFELYQYGSANKINNSYYSCTNKSAHYSRTFSYDLSRFGLTPGYYEIQYHIKYFDTLSNTWMTSTSGTKTVYLLLIYNSQHFSGWMTINGSVYYFNEDGSRYTSWLVDNGYVYYILPDSRMATGLQTISNASYVFGSDGKLLNYGPLTAWRQNGRTFCQVYGHVRSSSTSITCAVCGQVLEDKVTDFVARCYTLILDRIPDEAGLQSWTAQLKSKTKTASEIIYGFMYSDEFTNRNLSNSDAVEILYKAMLDRASDAVGKATWVGKLAAGGSYTDIINGFCGSTEFTALCASYGITPGYVPTQQEDTDRVRAFVRRCYKLILNRDADEIGLYGWTTALKSGYRSASEIIYGFMYSEEYTGRNLSNGDTIEILYKTMLNRSSDAAGKADWLDRLSKGQTIVNVINGFCGSQEFIILCSSYGINPGSVKAEEATALSKAVKAVKKTPDGEAEIKETGTAKTENTETGTETEPETAETLLGEAVQESVMNEEKAKEFIARCYKAALDREAGEAELTGWVNQIVTGAKSPDKIVRGFLFSDEFKARNLSNEEIVKILYHIYMNRDADPEGLAFWTAKLEVGTTLENVVKGFAASDEFKAILRDMKK